MVIIVTIIIVIMYLTQFFSRIVRNYDKTAKVTILLIILIVATA